MKYLDEIDGLRAIAVIVVLLFHVELGFVPGGFVGVDVFFVISGYLISRTMLREIDAGDFSIRMFYERRIRRIAPALLVTLFFSAFYCFLLPPAESVGVKKALFSALFSVSNFWFFATTSYFNDTSFNPLLHTWSLSVEEQFYLFLPPFLLLIGALLPRWRRRLILASALLSLAAAEVMVHGNASAAFFLPWLRAWELLGGTLLATVDTSRLGQTPRTALTLGGIALIVYAVVNYKGSMVFPGLAALLPVLGAAAVIAGCGTPLGRLLLANGVMRFFGRISYSLYLVHWPIVCAVGLVQTLSPKAQLEIIFLSVVLGYLSWRFVETPFRHFGSHRSQKPTVAPLLLAAAVAALCAVFTGVSMFSTALWQRYPAALAYAATTSLAYEHLSPKDCVLDLGTGEYSLPLIQSCLTPPGVQADLLVLGDSHALHFFKGIKQRNPGLKVATLAIIGCLPLLDDPTQSQCSEGMNYLFRHWAGAQPQPVSTVILSARWQAQSLQPLKKTVQQLEAQGIKVMVMGPSPEYRLRVPLMLAYETILSHSFSMKMVKPDRFEIDRQLRADPIIAPHYFSTVDALCAAGKCRTAQDGQTLYFDRDHFTEKGAGIVLDLLPLPARN